jgi:hypothetical protein
MLDSDVTVDFKNEMGLLHTITHTFANICAATTLAAAAAYWQLKAEAHGE